LVFSDHFHKIFDQNLILFCLYLSSEVKGIREACFILIVEIQLIFVAPEVDQKPTLNEHDCGEG
jgi:hypothetical protein